MKVKKIDFKWNDSYSIFASKEWLNSSGEISGYLGGFYNDELYFVLPYLKIKKFIFRYIQFQTAVIKIKKNKKLEKLFLEEVLRYLKKQKIDFVIPSLVSAISDIKPNNCIYCRFGSYVLDLKNSEDDLWKNLNGKHRNVIRKAQKNNLKVKEEKNIEMVYNLLEKTMLRSNKRFISKTKFMNMVQNIKNIKVASVYKENEIQGVAVMLYNKERVFYLYGGSIKKPFLGSMNLLHWELIKEFKGKGILKYDFLGARLKPKKGSKLEGIQRFKSRFGCSMEEGFIWKSSINIFKYHLYRICLFIRAFLNKQYWEGDIIDQETKNNINI